VSAVEDRAPVAVVADEVFVAVPVGPDFLGRRVFGAHEKIRPRAWIGSTSAPRSERRIQPGQSRLLLLMVLAARPTLAEVPLADLSLFDFIIDQGGK